MQEAISGQVGRVRRNVVLFLGLIGMAFIAIASDGSAVVPSHLDMSKNPYGCAACHKGHGRRGTAMLRKSVPGLCFNCHSAGGDGPVSASSDVYSAMFRRYKHPVADTARFHKDGEKMPEQNGGRPRHVSCIDCHNVHISDKDAPMQGVPGIDRKGMKKQTAEKESEICYRCHADSVNRPYESRNTREEFDPANESYHPVERTAKGLSVSLKPGMSGKTIGCADCHHPHGSEYPAMLRANYNLTDGPEMPYSYAICYSCHRRENILSDQGFKEHKRHIVFASASCATCHRAHGSRNNKRLIEFDLNLVRPNKLGALNYSKIGTTSTCSLSCHNVEHNGDQIEKMGGKIRKNMKK